MNINSQTDRFESSCSHVSVTNYLKGTSSLGNFEETREKVKRRNKLKATGLTDEEINIYEDYLSGSTENNPKYKGIQKFALEDKIHYILGVIEKKTIDTTNPSTLTESESGPFDKLALALKPNKSSSKFYPDQHPINHLKDIESDLFGHLNVDDIPGINKRRKLLRRFDRKIKALDQNAATLISNHAIDNSLNANKETNQDCIKTDETETNANRPSLWDVKEPVKPIHRTKAKNTIGPKPQTLYTIKDNKIVRLEPKLCIKNNREVTEFEMSDLIVPKNNAEKTILEGTRLSIDDIRSLPKFKNYESGVLSKILFLKNLPYGVTSDDLERLFASERTRPDIRIMTGKMRGQAFIAYQREEDSKKALQQNNGIILKGKPIIIQYGKGKFPTK